MKGFLSSIKSQLGVSNSYSRAKVKFNVNKSDNMTIQSLLDQLDKFCIRIREWYSYHFPEFIKIVSEIVPLAKIVSENVPYAKVVKLIKNSKDMLEKN